MPWMKGGQLLEACAALFKQNVSFQTLGCNGRKGAMKNKLLMILEESSESDEGNESGRDD